MKLVFYSIVLNHHQACVADELYKLLGEGYRFVELTSCGDMKGATGNYSGRPYLVRAWESAASYDEAMRLALEAEACVFSGFEAIPFIKARLERGLLSFDMGERLLKRGWLNLLSPRILRQVRAYHQYHWQNQPLYKLCCSSFTAGDCRRLGMFADKCYKWGYFTDTPTDLSTDAIQRDNDPFVRIMWCSRLLKLKRPDLPVKMARRLKKMGLKFKLDIYGDNGSATANEKEYPKARLTRLIDRYGLADAVTLHGSRPNHEILAAMRSHHIFLFTSNRREGWGAVANEALSNGCVLVASDAVGSTAYLIDNGYNGLVFRNGDVRSLTECVARLTYDRQAMTQMRLNALQQMRHVWSPANAATRLLQLIDSLNHGITPEHYHGPCSKA